MKFGDRDLIVELTPLWKGDRFDDGRPRVPDSLLKRLERVTTEESWAVGYMKECKYQFEGGFKMMHPDRVLVGRAVTAVFAPYRPDSSLQLNRFNIPEPQVRPSEWRSASQLDLLLLPLVAFDAQGNRVGMGGGFYDRTLAYLQHRRHWRKPVLIGLAHEVQKTDGLTTQSWDIPLDTIITESSRYPE